MEVVRRRTRGFPGEVVTKGLRYGAAAWIAEEYTGYDGLRVPFAHTALTLLDERMFEGNRRSGKGGWATKR